MARTRDRAGATDDGQRADLYQDITDKIIAELEAGRFPWVQPWESGGALLDMPHNAATRNGYSGINILILWDAVAARRFSTNAFLTFRQALALGGHVASGERGTTIVYAKPFTPAEEKRRAAAEGREAGRVPMLKRFTVFNTDQCVGLPEDLCIARREHRADLIRPEAEALIAATRADIRIGGDRAYYAKGFDYVRVPAPEAFFEPINWHRTCFHELGHWSGAASRLARDLSGTFGSPAYAREELVAEMTSAFICASLGITPTVRHADYVGSWLAVLREDKRAIVRAASAASRAANFILGFRKDGATDDSDGVAVEGEDTAADAADLRRAA